jgi:hypothetical protein
VPPYRRSADMDPSPVQTIQKIIIFTNPVLIAQRQKKKKRWIYRPENGQNRVPTTTEVERNRK